MRTQRYHCICPKCSQASMQSPSIAMSTGENVKWFVCTNCKAELKARLWPDLDNAREMLAEVVADRDEDLLARQVNEGIMV